MRVYRRAASLLLAFLFIISGAGCGEKEKPQKIDLREKLAATTNSEAEDSLFFGVSASESPQSIYRKYSPFADYLSEKLGIKVKLVQRRTYLELNELFKAGKVDFGRIATGGYVSLMEDVDVEILGLVTKDGSPYYRASIIVRSDSPITRFDELRGKTFAFVDRSSNSGFRYPYYLVLKRKADIDTFFSRATFTGGHDNSIMAVLNKDADGASVSSTSISRELEANPQIKGKIRIILESPPFSRGPVVVKKEVPVELKERLKKIMLNMHLDKEGRETLEAMGVDGFIEGKDSDFDSAREMLDVLGKAE